MITQGDVSDYMKLTDQSEEEAKGDYQKMLDEMASMLENFGASEQGHGRFHCSSGKSKIYRA